MPFNISISRRVLKNMRRLPVNIVQKFEVLAAILRDYGPTGPHAWQKYSKLSDNEYHCHLTLHYVACWRHEKGTITIEVYYVGSRENAPY